MKSSQWWPRRLTWIRPNHTSARWSTYASMLLPPPCLGSRLSSCCSQRRSPDCSLVTSNLPCPRPRDGSCSWAERVMRQLDPQLSPQIVTTFSPVQLLLVARQERAEPAHFKAANWRAGDLPAGSRRAQRAGHGKSVEAAGSRKCRRVERADGSRVGCRGRSGPCSRRFHSRVLFSMECHRG